jgi:hypothetical protein
MGATGIEEEEEEDYARNNYRLIITYIVIRLCCANTQNTSHIVIGRFMTIFVYNTT